MLRTNLVFFMAVSMTADPNLIFALSNNDFFFGGVEFFRLLKTLLAAANTKLVHASSLSFVYFVAIPAPPVNHFFFITLRIVARVLLLLNCRDLFRALFFVHWRNALMTLIRLLLALLLNARQLSLHLSHFSLQRLDFIILVINLTSKRFYLLLL